MKEIFKSLKTKIKGVMVETGATAPLSERSYGKVQAFTQSLAIIDEAEAKWEEDCCNKDLERRIKLVIPMLEAKGLYGVVTLIRDLVKVAGIKISEVV